MPVETSESKSECIRRMKACLSKLETEAGRLKGYNFQPSPDDVILCTPPKCGTTWLCQIVHSLRTHGNMDFEEINLVIPCLEMAHDSGIDDLDAAQVASPRVFKTHFWRPHCPAGAGRYVFLVRDPLEAGPSFFHFMQGWFFDAGEVTMEQFLQEFWLARGEPSGPMQNASHWHNIVSWFAHRRDPGVLWLHYEDLHGDLPAAVALIADFLGVGSGDTKLQCLAVEQSSIEAMRQFPEKYDEHPLKIARNEACGRPPYSPALARTQSGKVRAGVPGGNKRDLSPELRSAILAKWNEVVEPATGYASYADMRRGINAELGRPFLGKAAPP